MTADEHPMLDAAEHIEEDGYLSDEAASDDGSLQFVNTAGNGGVATKSAEVTAPLISASPADAEGDHESFDAIVARAGLPKVNSDEYRKEASAALHDEMMTLMNQNYDNEDAQDEARLEAQAIAKQLLGHLDIPAMTRVHAQMVLGCSEDEDALGFMRDALALLRVAVENGDVAMEEGEKLIQTCVALVGTEMVSEAAGEAEREEPFNG